MTPYPDLDALAARQYGLVTAKQCLGLGLSVGRIQHARAVGRLVTVRWGVYRWCGTRVDWRVMAMAAVLAAGADADLTADAPGSNPGAVLSHRSAARIWGLPILAPDREAPFEITAPGQRRLEGVVAHRHRLGPDEITRRDRLPVTSIERTLVDLAQYCGGAELGRLVDDALRRRLTTVSKLAGIAKPHAGPGRRLYRPIEVVLAERGVGYDPGTNDGERRMDRLWGELGLPASRRQYRVRLRTRTYILDRAIVDLKIGIEWNGREWHGTRSRFDYDADRRNDLIEAGWVVLDFTMNSSPARIARTVRAAVEQRRLLLLSA